MGATLQLMNPFYSDEEVSPEMWLGPRALQQWYAEQEEQQTRSASPSAKA